MASLFRAGISRAAPFTSKGAAAAATLPRRGFEEFFDPNRAPHEPVQVGRAWTAEELRRKSFEDLHKLWYVLYKERNVLLTEEAYCKRNRIQLPSPHRKGLVRKAMARIKQILMERKSQAQRAEAEVEQAASTSSGTTPS